MRIPTLKPREQRVLRDFRDALIGAGGLKDMMADAFSCLSRLVPADRGALCVTRAGTTRDYFWELANVPPAWFTGYAEMEKHDLVRQAVLRRPNKVLCESDIASLRTFQENPWVQRSRELGMSLTHVLSVMLTREPDWHGGITLYREDRSAFSERQKSLIEHEVVPSLLQAFSRCRRLGAEVKPSGLLEWLFHHFRGMGVVVVVPPSREVMRTEGTDALLNKWFLPHERRWGRLPNPLLEQFATVLRLSEWGTPPRDVWWDVGESENLKVSFLQLPPEEGQPGRWAWILEEVPHQMRLPWNWREELTEQERQIFDCWRRARPRLVLEARLTPREFEVAGLGITGLEIATIAEELGCEPVTVRVHLHNVYNKLGTENMTMLLSRAVRYR